MIECIVNKIPRENSPSVLSDTFNLVKMPKRISLLSYNTVRKAIIPSIFNITRKETSMVVQYTHL